MLNPGPYRGVFGSDAKRYAEDVQDHIDHGTSGKVAGFIAETIQVCFIYFVYHMKLSLDIIAINPSLGPQLLVLADHRELVERLN